jgi:hypothetical protein
VAGAETNATVTFDGGALQLSVPARWLRLDGATGVANFGSGRPAEAGNGSGSGRSLLFGYDPTLASPAAGASSHFRRAALSVAPSAGAIEPLSVQALEIDVVNTGPVSEPTRVSQTLDPALTALLAPGGTLTAQGFSFDFPLDPLAERTLLTLVRVPDQAGSWTASTTVGAVDAGGGLIGQSTQAFTLVNGRAGPDLLYSAVAAASALSRRDLTADLAAVGPCAGASAAQAESNIQAVLDTIDDAKATLPSFRTALDALLRYEESCWTIVQ